MLLEWMRAKPSEAMAAVKETGKIEDDTAEKFKAEIGEFNQLHWAKKDEAEAKAEEAAQA